MLKRFVVLRRSSAPMTGTSLRWRRTTTSNAGYVSYLEQTELAQTMPSMHSVSSSPCFHLLNLCRNISSLKQIHALLITHALVGDLLCDTKLISVYGSLGFPKHARQVFDQMHHRDHYSFKVMIRWYFLNDLYSEIIPFYARLRVCFKEWDNPVFSILLKACSELRDINGGKKVHCETVKVGGLDSFVQTGLVDVYAKCGEIECARKMFDEMPERNVVSWSSLISGYVQNDCMEEGLISFNRMREGLVEGNQYTLGSLVLACAKLGALHQGKGIHGYVIKNGFESHSVLVTALLDMYVKCGNILDARSVFDELFAIDLVSWTAMIVGYTQFGYPNEALRLFTDESILPNSITISSVLSSCAQLGSLKFGKVVHGLGIKLGLDEISVVSNALMDMYAKCREINDAHFIFETALDRDVITWNTIISGYSQNGCSYDALKLFNEMRSNSFKSDAVTLVSVLAASALLGALQIGSSLHACSIKEGILSSHLYVGTALLNFYAKCGDSKSARKVFDGMGEKNIVTWSAMIGGYGMQGDDSESFAIFDDMLKEELRPNEVIFTTILSACSHTGMVEEGWRYFMSMCQDYNFTPTMKHYACMVDLLARAGRLDEALCFIEKIPVRPDFSLFGAFLHGCGLYSRFDLGEVAIRRMLELHPNEACYYVLMSNLYASDGRWGQVDQIREMMKQTGLNKSPGCSLVETDFMRNEFQVRVVNVLV